MISLGPYELRHAIGRGGMGEVWSGVHVARGLPVAIKVLSTRDARSPVAKARFLREVQAVAGLDHPGIVLAYDYGEVTAEAEEGSFGRLVSGSPILAMELAVDSLQDRMRDPRSWEDLRGLLLAILDALAHAHARGVLHRDLKPGNVLLFEDRQVKLCDFGLAWTLGGESQRGIVAGTPDYMAPEQVRGDWRDFGPWTDLYALGKTAEKLAERSPVPDGFAAWMQVLTRPEPKARYTCAADAAEALMALGTVATGEPLRAGAPARFEDTFDVTTLLTGPVSRSEPMGRSRQLLGAGLGLYGLRRPPIVGREAEREVLWSALEQVQYRRRCRAVIVRGSAGTGKSRLAQWLCERAHELGAATPLKAVHGERTGRMDGLRPMFRQHLRCWGLDRHLVAARIATLFRSWEPEEVGALTELIHPLPRGEPSFGVVEVALRDRADRLRTVRRLLETLATSGPLVLWLDDAQWGEEALELANLLVEDGSIPALIVLTLRTEALDQRPVAKELVGALSEREPVGLLDVNPLVGEERDALVSGLLGFEGSLATAVAERSAGVPLFAVQLVDDWVQRGILQAGAEGWQLREGAEVPLPDELHGLWLRRIGHLLTDRAEDAGLALELAAVLGSEVSAEEWVALCDRAEVEVPADLVDNMVSSALAVRRTGDDWAFVHGMLAESVVRLADDSGRLRDHRLCCSETLGELGQSAMERGGMQAAEALLTRALERAPEAGQQAVMRGRLGRVQLDLGRITEAETGFRSALEMRGEIGERNYGIFLGNLGILCRRTGRVDEARSHFDEALSVHRSAGNRDGEGMVLGNLALLHMVQGRLEEALTACSEALVIHRELGNRHFEGVAHTNLGSMHSARGTYAAARVHFERALEIQQEQGNRRTEGMTRASLGTLLYKQGNREASLDQYEAALAIHRELENRRDAGFALANLAELYLEADRIDDALAAISEATGIARDLGERRAIGAFESTYAVIEGRLGNLGAARLLVDSSEVHLREVNDPLQLGILLCRKGEIEAEARPDVARSSLRRASDIAEKLGAAADSELGTAIAALRLSVGNA